MSYVESDNYLDSNDVLINKLGIKDKDLLNKTERLIVAKNILKLRMNPIQGDFDINHLQEIHRSLFGELYDWAGKLRYVDISKAGVPFAYSSRIIPEFEKLHHQIKSEPLEKLNSKDYVVERLAHYLGEINVIHPFREGNGRAQREFIIQLANSFGYELNFKDISQQEMIDASMQSRVYADNSLFEKLISYRLKPKSELDNTLENIKKHSEKVVSENFENLKGNKLFNSLDSLNVNGNYLFTNSTKQIKGSDDMDKSYERILENLDSIILNPPKINFKPK